MKIDKEKVRQRFLNKSDCYADVDNGLPIQAMTFDAVWELINALPAKVDEWVSVDDRLPEQHGYYNVSYKGFETSYVITVSFSPQFNKFSELNNDITHWQHLPLPPTK